MLQLSIDSGIAFCLLRKQVLQGSTAGDVEGYRSPVSFLQDPYRAQRRDSAGQSPGSAVCFAKCDSSDVQATAHGRNCGRKGSGSCHRTPPHRTLSSSNVTKGDSRGASSPKGFRTDISQPVPSPSSGRRGRRDCSKHSRLEPILLTAARLWLILRLSTGCTFQGERLAASLPGRALERHEGREGF